MHVAQVQHQATIDGAMTGDMMTPAANGKKQSILAGKVDPVDDVGLAGAADDEARVTIDRQVLDATTLVEARIARGVDRTSELHPQLGQFLVAESDGPARYRDN
jgi:hypothetical protein